MPLETFFNLPQEKQNRIIAAATREFAENGYRGGRIQAIAAEAHVAKGSIYQYFYNKEDLFFYLADLAAANQINALARSARNCGELPFFDALEALFSAGLRYAEENPDLYRLYRDLKQGAPQNIREQFDERITAMWRRHYENLLAGAAEEGTVRQDLNLDLAAFVVYTLISRFSEFLEGKGKLSGKQKEAYLNQCLEIIRSGLGVG